MTGNRQTLVDALNAEMLGDIQKMHLQLTSCIAGMEALERTQSAMAEAASLMQGTLHDTGAQFEMMAKGILIFARDEHQTIRATQQAEHATVTEQIFMRVRAVTMRLDQRVSLLLGLSLFNLIFCVTSLFLKNA